MYQKLCPVVVQLWMRLVAVQRQTHLVVAVQRRTRLMVAVQKRICLVKLMVWDLQF